MWHPGLTKQRSDQIEHIQKRSLKIAYPNVSYHEALSLSKLESLYDRRDAMCKTFFKELQNEDHKLHHLLPPPRDFVSLRNFRKYELPKLRTEQVKRSIINHGLFNYQ